MLKYCYYRWDLNRERLQKILEEDTKLNECDYKYLVKLVVEHILNESDAPEYEQWDTEHITEIDNGDYQGTLLYLIPKNTYQPSADDYLMTYTWYGSCSGCDTLQAIQDYGENVLTPEQVKDFMKLCKDLVMNITKPYKNLWGREEPQFDEKSMD